MPPEVTRVEELSSLVLFEMLPPLVMVVADLLRCLLGRFAFVTFEVLRNCVLELLIANRTFFCLLSISRIRVGVVDGPGRKVYENFDTCYCTLAN